jgi:transketolase
MDLANGTAACDGTPLSGNGLSPRLRDAERACLAEKAYQIRRLVVELVAHGQWGHIGGSLSMADILAVLYFRELCIDPASPRWPERDRLVLSKGHTAPGLYATLALRGFFPIDELYGYCEMDGMLQGHTDLATTPGVESSAGLLGMGLSVAQGMALAMRLQEAARSRVFCILGDGEIQEGNVWEAAMSASSFGLDNLIAILDLNRVQANGFVNTQVRVEPIADKWRAFGWTVVEVDGHDLDELAAVFYRARWVLPCGKPIMIVAHTVKGRGIKVAEFNYHWHTHAPNPATADAMLRDLARNYGRPEQGYSKFELPVRKEVLHV